MGGAKASCSWLFCFQGAMAAEAMAFFSWREENHDYCNEEAGNGKTD
jgi:hypothetical protein